MSPEITFTHDDNGIHVKIETERLLICSCTNNELEECVSLYSNQKLTKHFDHGQPKSIDEVKKLIVNGQRLFAQGIPLGIFSVFIKKDMAFVGQFDLMPDTEEGAVEIGCILNQQFHNQGFAKEITRIFLSEYTQALNEQKLFVINKVIATVHPSNLASKKLILQVGMTFEKAGDRFGHPRLWYAYKV